ncbi:MAG: hypothetical protein LBF28_02905 [Rickettsiales bacterium]|nr:hypothetical protein [Rickettsiales bacterium]
MGGKVYYGALGETSGQSGLNLSYDSRRYVLSEYCAGGTYSANGVSPCVDCGIGYYCTGGNNRKACAGGAIACNGVNHTLDAALPAAAASSVDKILTMDEINNFVPATNISQWRRLSCCNRHEGATVNISHVNDSAFGCATGTIGPGTYLFITRYIGYGTADSLDGGNNSVSSVNMMVFDRKVGYKSMHASSVFDNFVDVNNDVFQSYTHKIPGGSWNANQNISNVSDIVSEVGYNICVYELK